MDKGHSVKQLLIYSEFPDTFRSFRNAPGFIFRKASSLRVPFPGSLANASVEGGREYLKGG
jgi:hypothetical protein